MICYVTVNDACTYAPPESVKYYYHIICEIAACLLCRGPCRHPYVLILCLCHTLYWCRVCSWPALFAYKCHPHRHYYYLRHHHHHYHHHHHQHLIITIILVTTSHLGLLGVLADTRCSISGCAPLGRVQHTSPPTSWRPCTCDTHQTRSYCVRADVRRCCPDVGISPGVAMLARGIATCLRIATSGRRRPHRTSCTAPLSHGLKLPLAHNIPCHRPTSSLPPCAAAADMPCPACLVCRFDIDSVSHDHFVIVCNFPALI